LEFFYTAEQAISIYQKKGKIKLGTYRPVDVDDVIILIAEQPVD